MPAPKATTHQGNQRSCSKARWRDSASAIARRKGTTEDWDSGRPCGTAAASIMNRSGHSRAPSIRVRKLSPIRTAPPFVRSMEQPSKPERSIHTQHHDLIMTQVRPVLRFAPSPTGYLHIGGARTALFNWLHARHTGGRFLLRIEDTDRERSTPEAVGAIFNGLTWLGLDWDGEPTFQSARVARHREIAEQLLAGGNAYRCYATAQELDEMRAQQRAAGLSIRYDGRWRDREPGPAEKDRPFVVRLKAPREGETIVQDVVQGEVRWANEQLDDMVLLRSDGTPTYMLAVVVDDFDMGVTHVLRGVDHLNNAARQLQIIEAMGWAVPVYGHVPLIHGADGAKLSKRHGALAAEAYRDMGYLPEAMRNYLLRLGWSHGDDEIIPTEKAIEWFNLEGLGRSAARFDTKKLDSLNGHYIRETDNDALAAELVQFLALRAPVRLVDTATKERLTKAMPMLKTRAKTLVELM